MAVPCDAIKFMLRTFKGKIIQESRSASCQKQSRFLSEISPLLYYQAGKVAPSPIPNIMDAQLLSVLQLTAWSSVLGKMALLVPSRL